MQQGGQKACLGLGSISMLPHASIQLLQDASAASTKPLSSLAAAADQGQRVVGELLPLQTLDLKESEWDAAQRA